MSSAKYTPSEIEPKWQKFWAENNSFQMGNPGDPGFDLSKPKYYVLDMFPYPSGAGLHVGHPEGYTATDILARYKRMKGFNVLHPMGWDAYGLPAEQYAVQTGTHPAETTKKNVANMKRQIQSLGFSYDWSREVDTTDPKYYRWTQWIFLKLFNSVYDPVAKKARHVNDVVELLNAGKVSIKNESTIVFDKTAADAKNAGAGKQWIEFDEDQQWKVLAQNRLAYVSEAPVWWCEALGTVLANEEVTSEGRSDRGDHPCVKKPLRQWMLRITAYAERLIDDLAGLDWPEPIKAMQRNWIGKSEGAEVDFEVVPQASSLPVSSQETRRQDACGTKLIDGLHERGYLPHLKRAGGTYFVTFRLAGTLPKHILDELSAERERERTAGILPASSSSEELDADKIDAYLDSGPGDCWLKRPEIATLVANALQHFDRDRYVLHAWTVMPNHVHVIFTPLANHTLSAITHSWKSFTANEANKILNRSGEFWERESYDHLIRDEEDFNRCCEYTINNPVKAGLCAHPEDWPFGVAQASMPVVPQASSPVVPQASSLPVSSQSTRRQDACGTTIRVFTTRPDTLYGATYMVLAPEHPMVKEITTPEQAAAVEQYIKQASSKSDLARTDLAKDKSGVFTGAYAFNPVYEDRSNPDAKIPIWIADYVLMGYGTGAIMAVPAHDERDWEFAKKYNLPIVEVVQPKDFDKASYAAPMAAVPGQTDMVVGTLFVEDGIAVNSPLFDGLPTPEAKKKITAWLEEKKLGEKKITYRLRDWLFSRQRYWGEPFPIVWDERGNARALAEEELPVELPEMRDFKPTGSTEPPLTKATDWVNVHIDILPDGMARVVPPPVPTPIPHDTGEPAMRETNTMPQWAGSCWYFLRYMDSQNPDAPFSGEAEKYWMNVDLYVGGAEHAVLHLLYSRFWHKVMFDYGIVHTNEPFQRLFNQGMITAFAYKDETGRLIPNGDVTDSGDGKYIVKSSGQPATQFIAKMSKSLGNVINPDDVVNEYGADTLRLYEMFMGPLDGSKPWNPRDVPGMFRFLRDCWRMIVEDDERSPKAGNLRMNLLPSASEMLGGVDESLERELHKTIKGVTLDLERMAFNTAISKLMVFKNKAAEDPAQVTRDQAKRFVLLLAPFAPHLAEELWSRMRHGHSLVYEKWPTFNEAMTQDAEKDMAVQINGKLKGRITVAANAPEESVKKAALESVTVELAGKTIVKVIVVQGRLVNIVVK